MHKRETLTPDGLIVRKLLPLLRKPAASDLRDTVRTWRLDELEAITQFSKAAIRHALRQLKQRTDADLFMVDDMVRLNGPWRINYREALAPNATPCY